MPIFRVPIPRAAAFCAAVALLGASCTDPSGPDPRVAHIELAGVVPLPGPVQGIVHSPRRGRLYAAVYVGSADPVPGYEVVEIDPATRRIERTLPGVWSGRMLALSSDEQYLYAGGDGLSRIDLDALTVEMDVSPEFGVVQVLPVAGQPRTVVVTLYNSWDFFSPWRGSVVYDDTVPRPVRLDPRTGPPILVATDDPARLYGAGEGGSLFEVAVRPEGLVVTGVQRGVFNRGGRLLYDGGLLFSEGGEVVDPVRGRVVGRLPLYGSHEILFPDLPNGRVFGMVSGSRWIQTYSLRSFGRLGEAYLRDLPPNWNGVARVGPAGLAFATSSSVVLYSLR